MRFTGEIRIPELDHPGVPASLLVEDNQVEILLEGESLGRWSLYDVRARRLVSAAFQLILDGEEVTFIADEPVDFAYRGVDHMDETRARIEVMRAIPRGMAIRKSRNGVKPSRIGELREAMEANLMAEARVQTRPAPAPAAVEEERAVVEEAAAATEPDPVFAGNDPLAEERRRLEAERVRLAEERARLEELRREAEERDARRIEAFRLEMARLEAERAEHERIEAERARQFQEEMEKLRSERQRLQELEAQLTARAGDDAAREEAVRAEIERLEEARLAMERAEAERVAAARREMEEVEAKRRELERLETLQVEMDHRQQEMAEAEPEQEPVAVGAPIVSPDDEPDAPEVVDLDALHETEEKEPALAGAAAAKGRPGLLGAVKSAFTRGSRNHLHDFVPAPGGMGISRSICQECGYVSISSD